MNLEKEIIDYLGPIKITQEALDKGNAIAKQACQLAHNQGLGSLEVYLFNLNFIDRQEEGDIAIRDFYIAQKQKVSGASCEVGIDGKIFSRDDAWDNLGMRIIGWSHSHGDLGSFVSGTDRHNIENVVRFKGIRGKIATGQEQSYINSGLFKTGSLFLGEDEYGLSTAGEYQQLVAMFLNRFPIILKKNVQKDIQWTGSFVFNSRNHCPTSFLAYEIDGEVEVVVDYSVQIIIEENGIDTNPAKIKYQLLSRIDRFKSAFDHELDEESKRYSKIGEEITRFQEPYSHLKNLDGDNYSVKSVSEDEQRFLGQVKSSLRQIKSFLQESNLLSELYGSDKLFGQVKESYGQICEMINEDWEIFEQRIALLRNQRKFILDGFSRKMIAEYEELFNLCEGGNYAK